MVDYEYKDLFTKSHVDKQLKITTDDGLFTATNEDIHFEDFELTESLCSNSELQFGSCEAGMVKFQIQNAFIPLIGKWITITETLDSNTDEPFQYGRYKVFSDVPTADREYRDVMAYDAMYDIIGSDVSAWYDSILPNKDSAVTLKQFRESFIRYFGLTEVIPKDGLINDDMTVERTVDPEQMSGKDVITAVCEINGCFGHIGRDGRFHYIYLPQAIEGLYPHNTLYPDRAPEYMAQAKTGHLYPQSPKSTKIGSGSYSKCQYEDYRTKPVTRIQIRQKENDIGKVFPETPQSDKDNCYIIQDNFLIYGKSSEQLTAVAQNILSKITDIVYRPFSADCIGNPCFEVGDPVRFSTKYEIVESYILERKLKGIQALKDSYSSNGTEKYSENVNSIHKSIVQLKGKTNVLTRTIEETRLEMQDMDEQLSSAISATAKELRAELKNTKDGLESSISQTAAQIRTEVKNADQSLQSQITQNAGEIDLRVKKDGVIASINLSPETLTLQANRIDLNGLVNARELVAKFATIDALDVVEAKVNRIDADYASIGDLNAESAKLKEIISQKATIEELSAANARIGNLETDHVTVNDFNAEKAKISTIESTYITAGKVKADYMEVANWTSAGKIRTDRIDTETIVAKIGEFSGLISVGRLFVTEAQDAHMIRTSTLQLGIARGTQLTTSAYWQTITVGKESYTVLCQ